MSSADIQRYSKLIQFTLNDKDIEIILNKLNQPINSISTFNRRKLLLLFNNSLDRNNIINIIVNQQAKSQKESSITYSDVSLPSNSNSNLVIKMKKLFFYRNFTALTNWETISCKHLSNSVNLINLSKTIMFNLPEKIKKNILGKDNNSCKNVILLRSVQINSDQNEYYDSYPTNLKLLLDKNDYSYLLPREIAKKIGNKKERANYPTSLNNLVLDKIKMDEKTSNISIVVSYNNKSMSDFEYSLQIVACEEVPEEEIIDEVLKRPKKTNMDFMEELKTYLISKGDVRVEKIRVILKDSIFLKLIEIPFRGKNCKHLMPDDLKSYIKINKIKEDWLCRICNESCNPDDIFIDQFYIDLLAKHPYATAVDIYENGNYEVVEESNFDKDSDDDTFIEEKKIKSKRCCLKTVG
ncbi:Zinc finger, MIZ-type domain-containing protein [Strongyloides ratti]|uniref:Zinc finger, MIZ-type domain-containing protein n=1 Tax=Strongyloides ratti TaxID=34506 RepID=A0A090KZK3_STRRB|nr:Zinc finger, MIZ-type domain-containing protein [Strongyloides ratti]CEF61277.1 Zinc finger, MIZ-type domain-containing protein [Strongyloides ratti]